MRSGSDQPPSGRRRDGGGRKRWGYQADPNRGAAEPPRQPMDPHRQPADPRRRHVDPRPQSSSRSEPPPWRRDSEPPPWRREEPPTDAIPAARPPAPHRPPTRRLEPGAYETYGDVGDYPPPRDDRPRPPHDQPTHYPKKLTVTRVAALRSRQLTQQAVTAFKRAANADGADKSGLSSLTYATMLNYAGDAALAVALANTLFFSAASGESKGKVALYLLITVAPFAILAPVIGPLLDRLQRGRRFAMCAASAGQALMCVIMAMHFDDWGLYPAALGKMVLSKSFTVLKAAITPRVLPPEITLAKTNARLTVFGLAAGGVFGAIAALFAHIFGSPGALWFTVVICLAGAVQALRIPAWVEVTEGEVPASISAKLPTQAKRQPMGRHVLVSLWGNGTIRVLTGFLMMFAAFAVRAQNETDPVQQLLLLGLIAGAAGLGSFAGNAVGARIHVGHPEQVVIGCVIGALTATIVASFAAGIVTAAMVGLVGAVASALAKNSLDAVIQDDLPEESRASAFGRSETVLQLGWVFGGAIGVLLPPIWWLGFLIVSVLLAAGLAQTLLTKRGQSLIPGFGGDRPLRFSMPGLRPASLHEGPPPPAGPAGP
ncbi:MFS transporter [Alloactinosynnema sp. L-07]|uniref:MFS transporter n=1 Tax=Alloactinosynnema sp. L-07 TaxID=1653480 RepID=UPI0009EE4103|nr:MFS transporter [Alloactinosynnema sp. L-07]